ncbi:hypothetical protein [Pseudopedobacter saltans]|uniref:hypothetical protein n=1 Tax=Pseudopedobacter saltans TaxID=151895 RepID=UPI0005A12D86|nr:hypothetical protein [Pseudopedobacter saltans]
MVERTFLDLPCRQYHWTGRYGYLVSDYPGNYRIHAAPSAVLVVDGAFPGHAGASGYSNYGFTN